MASLLFEHVCFLYFRAVNMDSDYLKTHLGKCLSDCLTEVSEKRPLDPIEYIAQWLYKHIDNVKNAKQVCFPSVFVICINYS